MSRFRKKYRELTSEEKLTVQGIKVTAHARWARKGARADQA